MDVFVENPKQLRPLYRFLLGVVDPKSRPEFLQRSHGYWLISLEAAISEKWMSETEADSVSSGLLAYILGALDLWVHRDITDNGFKDHMVQGVLLHMLPFVSAKSLPALRARLKRVMLAVNQAR